MKAPFAYYGGKTGMAPVIAALLPPHRVYIEPFFGSGAVLFAKQPAVHEIINDADGAVVNFFRCLRDRRDELTDACALSPHSREEFVACRDIDRDVDDIERARRFWVRVNQSFAKTAGIQTGWSVTTARTQSIPASVAGRLGRFEAVAKRLMGTTIESCDAADLIDRLATHDTAVYADPPYLADTRRSRQPATGCADYRVDMGDAAQHERLAEALHATPAAVVLSGYHSDLYESLYGDWERLEVQTHAHGSNALRVDRGDRTEVLWSNRPIHRSHEQLAFDPAPRAPMTSRQPDLALRRLLSP